MNLFVTDPSPTISAKALDDVRLRKMILETAQMICTEGRRRGWEGMPYRSTHVNHPVVISLRNDGTLQWCIDYFDYLCAEYRYRFDKYHASGSAVGPFIHVVNPRRCLPPTFHNSARNRHLNLDFTHLPVFDAYRAYLSARWISDHRPPIWTRRGPPSWFSQADISEAGLGATSCRIDAATDRAENTPADQTSEPSQ